LVYQNTHLRKTAAIFLLLILLFNVVGYRAWFYYAEKKADRQLEARLDKNEYQEDDLITIKIPLNIPYQLDRYQFERVDGEFSFNGKIYKYVKRKVVDGNIILLCIPDANKMSLKKARTDFGNGANDIASSSTNKKIPSAPLQKSTIVSEYEEVLFPYAKGNVFTILAHRTDRSPAGLAEGLIAIIGKPPESLS
jgi:cbb3-type cytochrome oxidase subunit 3